MKRFYMWIVICAIVALITIVSWSHRVIAAVKSASTDGEATVYVMGKFSEAFDVAYRGRLNPGARNKSSGTTLSILLIGQDVPGPGVSIGLAGDPSHMHTVHPFTYAVYPNAFTSPTSNSTPNHMGWETLYWRPFRLFGLSLLAMRFLVQHVRSLLAG